MKELSSNLLIKRLYKDFLRNYKSKFAFAILAMVIVASCNALQAWLLKPALDDIFLKKDISKLMIIPMIIVCVSFIKAFASYFQNYLLKFLTQKITIKMQAKLFDHIIYSDLEYIAKFQSGKIISKFSNDINIIKTSLDSCLVNIAREFFTVFCLFLVMMTLNLQLSFITLIVIPIIAVPVTRLGKRMRKISHATQEELDNFISSLDETFVAFRAVKSFMAERYEIIATNQILDRIFAFYKKSIRIESIASPIVELVTGVAIAVTIWLGGSQAINGTTTPGTFFAFIAIVIAAYKPIKNLSDFSNVLQSGMAALNRYYLVIDTAPKIKSPLHPLDVEFKNTEIEFKNVSFKYGDKNIFDNFSVKFPAGLTIAIVGSSGCGKSTLLNLICRFYDVSNGEILIDGYSTRKISLEYLRNQVRVVTQEVFLFNKSVKENIGYGSDNYTDEQIIAAAKAADAFDFINLLENQFETIIGPKGLSLSGGQRQRISLARALLKNSPILLLDEATSSLDNISENKIQKSLKEYRKGKTTIVVAHRMSSIINADMILLLKDGKVEAFDKHDNLLSNNSYYRELYSASYKTDT